jgi:hypothetical protein
VVAGGVRPHPQLVISYGVNDCEAWLAACDLFDALDMCVPVATPEETKA